MNEVTKPTSIIICQSTHHGNTMKVAEAMAEILNAEIKKPAEVNVNELTSYDMIGLGSGIYKRKHHTSLFQLLDKLDIQSGRKVFIFSTSTVASQSLHKPLIAALTAKGFDIIGEFSCKGFMNYNFTRIFLGGLNKGRPNKEDLQKARSFAAAIKGKVEK